LIETKKQPDLFKKIDLNARFVLSSAHSHCHNAFMFRSAKRKKTFLLLKHLTRKIRVIPRCLIFPKSPEPF